MFIGKVGSGKSSTIKSLVDCPNLDQVFHSSSSADACTLNTVYK